MKAIEWAGHMTWALILGPAFGLALVYGLAPKLIEWITRPGMGALILAALLLAALLHTR